MTLLVRYVEPTYVSQIWPKVEGFIKDALQKGVPEGAKYSPSTNSWWVNGKKVG